MVAHKAADPSKNEQPFECLECKAHLPMVFLNGYYEVGERILEGVYFECRKEGVSWSVKVREDCAEYFSGLNQKKWLAAVLEACPYPSTWFKCPECDGDALPTEYRKG